MFKTVKAVRDAMAELDEKYKAAQGKAEKDGIEALTDDEKAQIRSYTSARNDLQEKLELLMQIEFTRSQAPVDTHTPGSSEYSESDHKDFNRFSLLRGLQLLTNKKSLDGIEKEVHEIGYRDAQRNGVDPGSFAVPAFISTHQQRGQSVTGQTTSPGDQGGVLIETQINPLIEAIWSDTFLQQSGATRLAGLTGDMSFPVQKTKPVAQEVTETEALTDQEILFEDFDMKPKRRGVTIPISIQLINQTSFDIQGFVIDVIRLAMEEKMNLDAVTELLSVITSANGNLIELGTNGVKLTYADIVKMETLLASSDRAKNTIKYLTNTKVRGLAKLTAKFENTNGNTIWEPGNTMNGYPAIISNLVPSTLTKGNSATKASAVFLGDFSKLFVGIWGGTGFVVDPFTLAGSGKVKITCNMFWNVKAGQPKSFVGIKDALTE